MAGLLEKTVLLGLGILTLTREKVKEAVDELVKEEDVEPEEARKLVDALVTKGEEQREELRKLIRQEIDRVKPVNRKEFQDLKQKIDDLVAEVEAARDEVSSEEAEEASG